MGGYGSGRRGGRPTAEDTGCYVLRASAFNRAKLQDERHGTGTIHVGEDRFPVAITVDTRATAAGGPHLELAHATRDSRRPGDERMRYRVPLLWTVPTYGGRRWWFRCPRTGRKVTQLYLPNGGWCFWSRQAYRLGYACQREVPHDRLLRRAQKLHLALGGDGAVDFLPLKPKWMRWRTYERQVAAIEALVDRADAAFFAAITIREGRLVG